MNKRHLFLIGAIGLGLGISDFEMSASLANSKYTELVEKCKQIRIGATEEQVHQLLGPPARIRTVEFNGRQLRNLMYTAPSLVSSPPVIVLDATSRRVVNVVCDDSFELMDKN